MRVVEKFLCRAARLTQRLRPTMWSVRSYSCWTASRKSRNSTPNGLKSDLNEDGSLLRAADLIGQLGDPNYLRKSNALYYEFEENGLNRQLGYQTPADLFDKYPQFYWNSVFPHTKEGIRCLNVTSGGRQWIAASIATCFAPNAMCTCLGRSHRTADPGSRL